MGLLVRLFAGGFVKILSMFGTSFVKPFLDYYASKEAEGTRRQGIWAAAMVSALEAQTALAEVKTRERIALWSDPWYKFITALAVVPPIIFLDAVLFVSVFHKLGWVVKAPAPEYVDTAMTIVLSWVGALGGTGAIVGAAREFNRK